MVSEYFRQIILMQHNTLPSVLSVLHALSGVHTQNFILNDPTIM